MAFFFMSFAKAFLRAEKREDEMGSYRIMKVMI